MSEGGFKPPLPLLSDSNRFFWTSGAQQVLSFRRCRDCGFWQHPPSPICPRCWSENVAVEPSAGRGWVKSFTVNHQRWAPDMVVPFVIAVVELDEQPGLQITTNLIGTLGERPVIGARVQVTFRQDEDVWLPLFEVEG